MGWSDLPIPTEEGYFVSESHRRVAEIIADFDPNLRLAYIPYSQRNPDDPNELPFAVIDLNVGRGEPYFVLYGDESDITSGRLLARLFESDNKQGSILSKLEAEEAAREAMKLKEQIERLEQMEDIQKTFKRKSFS